MALRRDRSQDVRTLRLAVRPGDRITCEVVNIHESKDLALVTVRVRDVEGLRVLMVGKREMPLGLAAGDVVRLEFSPKSPANVLGAWKFVGDATAATGPPASNP